MRTLVGVTAVAAPLASLALLAGGNASAALGLFLAGGVVVMTPILRPNVQWLGPVMTHFDTPGRQVWLTIDDGPGPDTPVILEALAKRGVRATFFVKGMLATPAQVDRIVGAGHTVANHTWSHPAATFWCLPPAAIAAQIDRCQTVIPKTTLFRSPVGMKNIFVHPLLEERGMMLVGFSARAFDAVVRDPERIARTIAGAVDDGAIILLHQGRPWSVSAIEATIDEVRARGYEFVIPDAPSLRP